MKLGRLLQGNGAEEAAEAAWARLAPMAGLDPQAFRPVRDWQKDDTTQHHIVRLMERADGHRVVLKRFFRPTDPQSFRRVRDAQTYAAVRMPGGPFTAPPILADDVEGNALLMGFARGRTFLECIYSGMDRDEALAAAGLWIAAFHTATYVEDRTFQPKFMRNHLSHLLEELDRGDIVYPAIPAFREHAIKAIAMANLHEGRTTKSARTHGDMNMRNVLLDGDSAAGIDFTALHDAPVGFDIARFLLNWMGWFGEASDVPEGEVVTPSVLSAFFDGYRFVGPDDPSVQYLLRVRLLMDWGALPARRRDRSVPQELRLQRLKKLARRAFP